MTDPGGWWQAAAAHVQAEVDVEVLAEAGDLRTAEWAQVGLVDRLARARTVEVRVSGGMILRGTVTDRGPGFVGLVDGDGREHLLRLDAVSWVRGLPTAIAREAPRVPRTWGSCVRELLGELVEVQTVDGVLAGRLEQVGADHLDLLEGESRGVPGDRCLTVPYSAVSRLSRRLRMDASGRTPASGRTSG